MSTKQQPIFIVCGAPGSGKSWVCEQLSGDFKYVRNDDNIKKDYAGTLLGWAKSSDKPIVCDSPFGISDLIKSLREKGATVLPFYIIESEAVTKARYEKRDNKPIPKHFLSMIKTYQSRAKENGYPQGTSEEIVKLIKATLHSGSM